MPNFSVTLSQKVLVAVTSSQLGVFVRFSITPDNQKDVWIYIYNKLQNDSSYLTFDDCKKEDNAKALFRSIKLSDDSATNDLDTLCKTFLQDKQISSLRSALRKKSSRRNRDTLTIELDRDVYSDLNDLAAADDTTLKDYLAALIQDRYQVVQPPVAVLAKRRNKSGVT